jgi:hypothetical protein
MMDLERQTSDGMIVENRAMGFCMAYQWVSAAMQQQRPHIHPPFPMHLP